MRSLSSKKRYQEVKIKDKVEESHTKNRVKAKEKPPKKKSSSTSKKWENRSGSKKRRWRAVRHLSEERCGDDRRSR